MHIHVRYAIPVYITCSVIKQVNIIIADTFNNV